MERPFIHPWAAAILEHLIPQGEGGEQLDLTRIQSSVRHQVSQ